MADPGYGDWHTSIHFRANNEMPMMVYNACLATGTISNTRYVQEAVVAALSRDLGIEEEVLLAMLPPGKTRSLHLYHPKDTAKHATRVGNYEARIEEYRARISGNKTIEDVT